MSTKTKKIVNVVVNVVVAVIVVLVLFLAINIISSRSKGYTSLFGKAYLVVQSDSMKGSGEDNFETGDLIVVELLDDDEKADLEVGDIITFYYTTNGERIINSHRIVGVNRTNGAVTSYTTKGDNVEITDSYNIVLADIIGEFDDNWGKIGKAINWFNSSTGFFVCVVIPSFLVVVYCAINLYLVIRQNKREKAGLGTAELSAEEQERIKQEEREKLKAELLAELKAEQENNKEDKEE